MALTSFAAFHSHRHRRGAGAALALTLALLVPAPSGAMVLRAEENAPQAFTDAVLTRLALIQHQTASTGVPQTFPQLQQAVQSVATCCGFESFPIVVDPETAWSWDISTLLQKASGTNAWLGETASVDERKAQIAAVLGEMDWRYAARADDRGQLQKMVEEPYSQHGCNVNDATPDLIQKITDATATVESATAAFVGNTGIDARAFWYEIPNKIQVQRTRDFHAVTLPSQTAQRPIPGYEVDGAAFLIQSFRKGGPGNGIGMGDVTVTGLGPVSGSFWTPVAADWDASGTPLGTIPAPPVEVGIPSVVHALSIPAEFLLADASAAQPVFHPTVGMRLTGQEPPPQYLQAMPCSYGDGGAGASWITGTGFGITLPGGGFSGLSGTMIYHQSLPPLGATPREADLAIVKKGPLEKRVGARMSYEIRVTNKGPAKATNVVVTDVWDLTTATLESTPNGCEFTVFLRCELGSIGKGVTKSVLVNLIAQKPGILENAVSAHHDGVDPTPSNDEATFKTTIKGLELLGLEVTQAIQSLRNSVPLISDRSTWVRAYVRSLGGDQASVPVELSGSRAGQAMGTLQPTFRPSKLIDGPILGYAGGEEVGLERSRIISSYAFRLPRAWVLEEGTLNLRFRGSQDKIACNASGVVTTEAGCEASVFFTYGPSPVVTFFAYSWRSGSLLQQSHRFTTAHLAEAIRQIYSTWPISEVDYSIKEVPLLFDPPEDSIEFAKVIASIGLVRALECGIGDSCEAWYMGLIPDQPESVKLDGLAISLLDSAAAYVRTPDVEYSIAHELGHLAGRDHSGCDTEQEAGIDPNYPYGGGKIYTAPTTTPVTEHMYGFDVLDTFPLTSPRRIATPGTCDLMGYPAENSWVSDYTYLGLHNALLSRNFNGATRNYLLDAGEESLVVTGSVPTSGGQATLGTVLQATAPAPIDAPTPGEYTLVLRDAQGAELASYPFEAGLDADIGPDAHFVLMVPIPEGLHSLAVKLGSEELVATTASPSVPLVQLASPNGGAVDGAIEVSWDATDADGDALTSTVQFSPDNGGTWQTLAVDLDETAIEIDTATFAASSQGLFRVLVSDGFNTGSDVSDAPLTIGPKAPRVFLEAADGAVVYGDQPVILRGQAFDPEDGLVQDESLGWTVDGSPIGKGAWLDTTAAAVGTGSHVVTLQATDADGMTGTASVVLHVFPRAADVPICAGSAVTMLGTSGADDLTATLTNDVVGGLGGNDLLATGTGNDKACGGGGRDRISGGGGKDVIRGDAGDDVIDGGPGRDVCYGGPGRDRFKNCEVKKP